MNMIFFLAIAFSLSGCDEVHRNDISSSDRRRDLGIARQELDDILDGIRISIARLDSDIAIDQAVSDAEQRLRARLDDPKIAPLKPEYEDALARELEEKRASVKKTAQAAIQRLVDDFTRDVKLMNSAGTVRDAAARAISSINRVVNADKLSIDGAVEAINRERDIAIERIVAEEAKQLSVLQAAVDERIQTLLLAYTTFLSEAGDKSQFEHITNRLHEDLRAIVGAPDNTIEVAIAKAGVSRNEASVRLDEKERAKKAAAAAQAAESHAEALKRIETIIAGYAALLETGIDLKRINREAEVVLEAIRKIAEAPESAVEGAIARVNGLRQEAILKRDEQKKAEEARKAQAVKVKKLNALVDGLKTKCLGEIRSAKTPAVVEAALDNVRREIERLGSGSDVDALAAPILIELEGASASRLAAIKVAADIEAQAVEARIRRSVESLALTAERFVKEIGHLILPAGLEELVNQAKAELLKEATKSNVADRVDSFLVQIDEAAKKKRALIASSMEAAAQEDRERISKFEAGKKHIESIVDKFRSDAGKAKGAKEIRDAAAAAFLALKGITDRDFAGLVIEATETVSAIAVAASASTPKAAQGGSAAVPAGNSNASNAKKGHKRKGQSSLTKHEETDLQRAIRLSMAGQNGQETELDRAIRLSLEAGDALVDVDNRPGRLGIRNLGMTCYLAASVQLLAHSRQLMDIVLREKERMRTNPITSAFFDMVSMIWRDGVEKQILDPTALVASLHALRDTQVRSREFSKEADRKAAFAEAAIAFTPYRMEDAHEATKIILDALMTVTTVDGRSPVKDLFVNSFSITKRCPTCSQVVSKPDPHQEELLLHLVPLSAGKASISLEDCLRAFSAVSTIAEYRCETCAKKVTAEDWTEITSVGPLALIVLKRFNGRGQKIPTPITLPPTVSIGSKNEMYRLIGVVNHLGNTPRSGHYTADVFHDAEQRWLNANDRAVKDEKSPAEVASTTPYLLLYERIEP